MKISSTLNIKVSTENYVFQYLAAITGTLSIICSGMHYGWPSPSLLKLKESNIPTSNHEGSWMAVMVLLGAINGSLIVASIIDIIGRKKVVLISSFPFFLSWMMIAFASSVVEIYAARFIAGIADGLVFSAIPAYLGEISEPRIRGMLGSGVSVTWIFGILLMNIIGSFLSISTAALVASLLPVIVLVTFVWMPESPYFLIMKGKIEEARKSLRTFRGVEDVEAELARLSNAVRIQTANSGKMFDLVTVKSNRKALFIMMGLRGAQQFSGATAITFYAKTIFKEGATGVSASLITIIYFSIQFLLSMFSSIVVDRTGRKPLLIISITGAAIALFTEGLYSLFQNYELVDMRSFSFLPAVALIGYVVMFSVGMQTIPILMLGELFPTNVKAFALCFADIYFSAIATVVSKFFQIMMDDFGLHVPFFVFTGCCIFGLVFIIFCVPETKGKTLEEIQQYLRGEPCGDGLPEKSEKIEV